MIKFASIKTKVIFGFTLFTLGVLIVYGVAIFNITSQTLNEQLTPDSIERLIGADRLQSWLQSPQSRGPQAVAQLTNMIKQEQEQIFLRQLFWVTLPLIALAGAGGYLVAMRFTSPLIALTKQVSAYNLANLNEELTIVDDTEEFHNLTNKFNELRERILESFDQQERFIQDASHELRTPIAAIKANLQVLETVKNPTKAQLQEVLDVVNGQIEHLNSMAQSLLEMKSSKVKQLELIDISELTNEVVESFVPLASEDNISIKCDIKDGIEFKIDNDDFIKIMTNLVENAIKYSKKNEHSVIQVYLWKPRGYSFRLSVIDNGVGIAREDLGNIFDRFFRGENYDKAEGSGLGLSIVKKIINSYGGDVKVKSRLGKGSEFMVWVR